MTPPLIRVPLLLACVLALLLVPAAPARATSRSGTDSRPVGVKVFSEASPFYQKLPDTTPTASNSKTLVASLNQQAHQFYGTEDVPSIGVNTNRFTPGLYVARSTDPVYDIKGWNCQHKWNGWDAELNRQLQGVHVPDDLQPDPTTDGSVSIYNPDTNEIVELWKAQKVNGEWQACWGGKISHTDQALGSFAFPYGASASGLSLWSLVIRQKELLDGRIDHVINLALPRTKAGTISWPGNRTDGNTRGEELAIGQMLRLPASLNLDKLKLSPAARTIARAAQEYGILITDTSGSVAFSAENPIALAKDQNGTIFRGRWPFQEMLGDPSKGEDTFPLEKLVALPLDYQAPASATQPQLPPSAPAPKTNTAYAKAVKKARPSLYWRLSDTGTTAADSSGKKRTGTFRGVARGVAGALAGNTAVQTYGDATSGVYRSGSGTPSKKFTAQVWFRTSTTLGGKIFGFENTRTGKGSRADRSLYMTNDGRLAFGTFTGTVQRVVSTTSYNDDRWHQATATQTTSGTRLYVDGVLVASNPVKSAQSGSGYWRLGGGKLDGWPQQPSSSYFAGALDEFAVYGSALSAATIAGIYKAAS